MATAKMPLIFTNRSSAPNFLILYLRRFGLPHGDAPGSRFDVLGKMVQLEETNVGIALATVRLGDEDMGHFLTQKSAKIKRVGYNTFADMPQGEGMPPLSIQ